MKSLWASLGSSMLRNEDHFAFERFSLNLCKLSSLNVRIIIFLSVQRVRVASSKYFFVHCFLYIARYPIAFQARLAQFQLHSLLDLL